MNLQKLPFEKLFFFIAGVIPGSIALLVFQLSSPGSFSWFFLLSFLGYKTKISLILIVSFIVGNSLTVFLSAFLGMIGGVYAGLQKNKPYIQPHTMQYAPWRDLRWRLALRRRLSDQAPNDTSLIFDELFKIRKATIELLPVQEQPAALVKLLNETSERRLDDSKWSIWYEQFHMQILTSRKRWDVQRHVQNGLTYNMQTAAVYILVSAFRVPVLRHWWCIVPCLFWVFILVAEVLTGFWSFRDKWSTLQQQIEYLTEDNDFLAKPSAEEIL